VDTTKLFGPYLKLELGMRGFRVSVENFNWTDNLYFGDIISQE
jgi:hypothetical protein